jgi:hypothetical protein
MDNHKLTVTGDTDVGGDLNVAGDAKVDGNLTVNSTLTVDGNMKIRRNVYWNEMEFFSGHESETRLILKGFSAGSSTSDTDVQLSGISNIYASGNVNCNALVETSDDRYKENEELITNATDTLKKLKPQLYDKKLGDLSQRTSGLLAQDVWYDAPELRHLVSLGEDADGTTATPQPLDWSHLVNLGMAPNYSSYGWLTDNPSGLNYTGFIAYLIKSNQELSARLDALEAP